MFNLTLDQRDEIDEALADARAIAGVLTHADLEHSTAADIRGAAAAVRRKIDQVQEIMNQRISGG